MMFDHSNTLIKSLEKYGISTDEASIYLYTSENGPSTALKLSKELHFDRARVYRLLDKLQKVGLVSQKMGERGFVFEAEPSSKLEALIIEKDAEVASLKELHPFVEDQLAKISSQKSDDSKVLYYQGQEGLKQVTWNSLKAQKKLRIIEVNQDMSAFIDVKFAEEVRKEFVKRRIHIMQLTNLKRFEDYTKVVDLVKKYWTVKYIDPKLLKIDFEVLVYNDVVALYNIRGKDMFCVEIYDKRLVQMQKQMFDFVWKMAKDMEIVSDGGAARLV